MDTDEIQMIFTKFGVSTISKPGKVQEG